MASSLTHADALAALASFQARVDPHDPAAAALLASARAATAALAAAAPAPPPWRLSNPLPPAGAPPPGADDALSAYIEHVAQEAADGRADETALAVLDEGERGEAGGGAIEGGGGCAGALPAPQAQ